jgi:aquaporin Z
MMLSPSRKAWPQYLMEAFGLGLFMLAACVMTGCLEAPSSVVHLALPNPVFRRFLIGLAMGLTAVGLMYSPWGKSSGAHYNPAVTLTFLRLKRIEPTEAIFYILAQCGGGLLGVLISAACLKSWVTQAPVNYIVTVPSAAGDFAAFGAEFAMAGALMFCVLFCSRSPKFSRFTPLVAGLLIAIFVTVEAPLSGMSINPARSLASALPAGIWDSFWIYLCAPPLGMLLAAEFYLRATALEVP